MATSVEAVSNADNDPLHVDWLIVKQKPRNLRASKSAKNSKDYKGKAIMNINNKRKASHAYNATSEFLAKSKKVMSQKGDQAANAKTNSKPPFVNVKNKRQGQENEVNTKHFKNVSKGVTSQIKGTMGQQTSNSQKVNGDNNTFVKVFDVGHWAKSTMKMKALSANRFILLHDEEDVEPNNSMKVVNNAANEVPLGGMSQQVVPETQPISVSMAI